MGASRTLEASTNFWTTLCDTGQEIWLESCWIDLGKNEFCFIAQERERVLFLWQKNNFSF